MPSSQQHATPEITGTRPQAAAQTLESQQSFIELFDDGGTSAWPQHTDEMCRWCMHKFAWFPVGLPVRYDKQRCRMVLKGHFCSFACAAAYASDRHIVSDSLSWLRVLARRCFGVEHIVPAPPREWLNRCTIDEFRAVSAEKQYTQVHNAHLYVREKEYMSITPATTIASAPTTTSSTATDATTVAKTIYSSIPDGLRPPPCMQTVENASRRAGVLSMLGATVRPKPVN